MAAPEYFLAGGRTQHFPDDVVQDEIERNMMEYWLEFGRTAEGQAWTSDTICWTDTGTPFFNRVLRAEVDEDRTELYIEAMLHRFRSNHAALTWIVGPTSSPTSLGDDLVNHGFADLGQWYGMARSLHRIDPIPLDISGASVLVADNPVKFQDWLSVIRQCFDFPDEVCRMLETFFSGQRLRPDSPWSHIVAYIDERPVAAATLYQTGVTAGVYLVGTIPEMRGNGLGKLVTWRALRLARSHHCDLAVLQATPEARNMYEQLGFQEYCQFGIFRMAQPSPLWKRFARKLLRRE